MPGRGVITMVSFDTESNDCMRAHKVGTFNPARLPCTRSIGASGPFRKTKASPQRFGWILVELCTVLIMPVLLEFDSWTGQVIGRCSHLGFVQQWITAELAG